MCSVVRALQQHGPVQTQRSHDSAFLPPEPENLAHVRTAGDWLRCGSVMMTGKGFASPPKASSNQPVRSGFCELIDGSSVSCARLTVMFVVIAIQYPDKQASNLRFRGRGRKGEYLCCARNVRTFWGWSFREWLLDLPLSFLPFHISHFALPTPAGLAPVAQIVLLCAQHVNYSSQMNCSINHTWH